MSSVFNELGRFCELYMQKSVRCICYISFWFGTSKACSICWFRLLVRNLHRGACRYSFEVAGHQSANGFIE